MKSTRHIHRGLTVGVLLALPVKADPIPSGEYTGESEGASVTMTVDGNKLSVGVGGLGCAGGGQGEHIQLAKNEWIAVLHDGDLSCELNVTKKGQKYLINEQEGCMAFHGFSCGFSSTVQR